MRALFLTVVLAACNRDSSPTDTAWHDADGGVYRWRTLDVPRGRAAGFTLLPPSRTGISFSNSVSESLLVHNRQLAQGAGVCMSDVDGDRRPDVFLARTEGSNALYRNLGDWRFEDVAERAGVAAPPPPSPGRFATGCAFADIEGDGDADLILLSLGGPNAVFVNDGAGHFSEQAAGLTPGAGSMTVAVADVDGDGDLDLYVANNKSYTALDRIAPQERAFDRVTRKLGPNRYEVRERYRRDYKLVDRPDLGGINLIQRADLDFFLLNDGTGHFVREPLARNPRFRDANGAPLREEREDFGLAAMFADLNGDGAPDLYVANDFEDPDQFWLNDGRGSFRLAPWYALRATSNSGMAVAVGDVNRDGYPDLFEVDMMSADTRRLKMQIPTHTAVAKQPGIGDDQPQMQRNTLQLNRGDGTFAEVARFAGVGRSGWSWSTVFLDVDLDGWEDILVGTGHVFDVMDGDTQYRLRRTLSRIDWRRMLFEYPPLKLPNMAFRNRGDLTFEDASKTWHFDVGDDISHGMALADLDGDGDLDVVINRLGDPAAVLRNDATAPRVAVRLRGTAPNTAGIGSRVRVLGGPVRQDAEIIGGGLYLSSSDASLTFATGTASQVRIEVDWRGGRRSVIDSALPNREFEISEPSDAVIPAHSARRTAHALFEDVTIQLAGHTHVEPYFDDYQRQLLLPNSFSQLGPGVAWHDLDGDGKEDLIVGAGRSGRIAFFQNTGTRLRAGRVRAPPAAGDLTTILGWSDRVIAGVAAYEASSTDDARTTPSVVAYAPRTGAMTPLIGGDTASVGPLALADYDGDADLDLFVGTRIYPAGYPLSPSSRLYRNSGGRFSLDTTNSRLLDKLGMVSAALFSDIDGDGDSDLLVAVEWGAIRCFRNQGGRFVATDLPGPSDRYSRWNGLATGDLDGDGRLDIVATTWGRNTDYGATPARPLLLYVGFFTGRGRPDILLAQDDPRLRAVAPLTTFDRLTEAFPGVTNRLGSFRAYADASIDQVLGTAAQAATKLGATTMEHVVFLNRGDRFEARPLPAEAQWAPAFYAGVADFNGDGNEDLFLSQNLFATEIPTPRYDAGRSLLLLGDGTGEVEPVPGQRSGLLVYGEQRGAAYADFDADGRLDLAVSQNGAPSRLFRNVAALPGLRVRIVGPAGNPTGIGTHMRLRYGDRAGPVREVQAGSGYWSQNGAVQVLGRAVTPTALWVRWPGGREQTVPLSAGQREVILRP